MAGDWIKFELTTLDKPEVGQIADLADIERAVPRGAAAGPRYIAQQMAMLDSERGRLTAG